MQPCFIPGHKNRVFPYFTSRTISDLQLLAICDTAAIAVGGARFAGESLGRELAIAKKCFALAWPVGLQLVPLAVLFFAMPICGYVPSMWLSCPVLLEKVNNDWLYFVAQCCVGKC